MRTGGKTGGSDIPDGFSLFYPFAGLNPFGKFGEMHISGGIDTVVLDGHVIPAPVGLIGFFDDDAITDGLNGSACRAA